MARSGSTSYSPLWTSIGVPGKRRLSPQWSKCRWVLMMADTSVGAIFSADSCWIRGLRLGRYRASIPGCPSPMPVSTITTPSSCVMAKPKTGQTSSPPGSGAAARGRLSGLPFALRPLLVHQLAAQDLARERLRDRLHELQLAHLLVGSHPVGDELHDLLGGGLLGGPEDDERLGDLAAVDVRLRDHGGVGDGGGLHGQRPQLGRRHLVAPVLFLLR